MLLALMAACLTLFAPLRAATAQIPTHELARFLRADDASAPRLPTIEEVAEQLRLYYKDERVYTAAPGEPSVREGPVRSGEVFAAIPIRYLQVARVRNDVYRKHVFRGGQTLWFPAGTPLFRTRLYDPGQSIDARRYGPLYWCGVRDGAPRRASCMFTPDVVRVLRSDFPPHFPLFGGVEPPGPIDTPDLIEDHSPAADLPAMEQVYVFRGIRRIFYEVDVGVRIEGQIQILWRDKASNTSPGIGTIQVGDGVMRLTPGADQDSIVVEVERAPTRYFDLHDSLYQRIGEAVLVQLRREFPDLASAAAPEPAAP
jgi:hypothetical protein